MGIACDSVELGLLGDKIMKKFLDLVRSNVSSSNVYSGLFYALIIWKISMISNFVMIKFIHCLSYWHFGLPNLSLLILFFFRQCLTIQHKLASNSWSSTPSSLLLVLQMCTTTHGLLLIVFFFCWYWELNSGSWAFGVGGPPLKPLLKTFLRGVLLCAWAGLDHSPPICAFPCSWDDRYHVQSWLKWGLVNFLPRLASNYDPSNLHLLSS
jgi:hypothetical protein